MPDTPPRDLAAQVVLFAVQVGIARDAALFNWLECYLKENFQCRPVETARDTVSHLIQYKSFSEDARAWRLYVAIVLKEFRRRNGGVVGHRKEMPSVASTRNAAGTLAIKDAAREIGVCQSSLYAWVASGAVQVSGGAGPYRFTAATLERLAKRQRRAPVIKAVEESRSCTYATARKFVYRQQKRGLTLEQILMALK